MDIILDKTDELFFTPYLYPDGWPRNDILRQFLSLYIITTLFGYIFYFLTSGLNYWFVFDHRLMNHPQFLKNQIRREILLAVYSMPGMGLLTTVCFLLEVRGFSKLYDDVNEVQMGWLFLFINTITFILVTDMGVYWVHRCLHLKYPYRYFHKLHHTWKIPTPFASYSFHTVDGFMQSFPYHIYTFLFPLQKVQFFLLFMFVNIWAISIHDGDFRIRGMLRPIINGSAHHSEHHRLFNCNYGQYFTFWDRIIGTYYEPKWEHVEKERISRKQT